MISFLDMPSAVRLATYNRDHELRRTLDLARSLVAVELLHQADTTVLGSVPDNEPVVAARVHALRLLGDAPPHNPRGGWSRRGGCQSRGGGLVVPVHDRVEAHQAARPLPGPRVHPEYRVGAVVSEGVFW